MSTEHTATVTGFGGERLARCACGWERRFQAGGGAPYHSSLLARVEEDAERAAREHRAQTKPRHVECLCYCGWRRAFAGDMAEQHASKARREHHALHAEYGDERICTRCHEHTIEAHGKCCYCRDLDSDLRNEEQDMLAAQDRDEGGDDDG